MRDTAGYVERIGVAPGETVRFHLATLAAYELDVVRLGRRAILDPGADTAADRAEAEVLASFRRDRASPRKIRPGSYVEVAGPSIPAGPLTWGLWLRLWRLPVLDEVQVAWSGLIGDLDYPERCRFGLLVDHLGRLAIYPGDGRVFDHVRLLHSAPILDTRLGRWHHVAATIEPGGVTAFLDGRVVLRARPDGDSRRAGLPDAPAGSRLRIGAMAERGLATDFLDGDIAAPFVAAGALDDESVALLADDRATTPWRELAVGPLHAAWDLAEERGEHLADASGHGRHGTIIQGGTWQVGGPGSKAAAADAMDADGSVATDPVEGPGIDPSAEDAPSARGHGLRLSSDDLLDAGWPVSETWSVPLDADSGLYAGIVRLIGQDEADATVITFAVVRRRPRRPDSVALLLATSTWYAYGRRPADSRPAFGLSASFYSVHASGRPFFWLTTQAPIPRATPFGFESERAAFVGHSHLVRPERFAEAWLEREGYRYEVITDHDLHDESDLLRGFRALFVAGHSEYWSDEARDGVERFLDAGGRVLSLSGNSVMWRVTFDEDMSVIECRKEVDEADPRWLDPGRWDERRHSHDGRLGGSYRRLGRPAHQTLGLDFQGMIDDGTPAGFSALRVLAPEHPLFHEPETVAIDPDGTIGGSGLNGPRASGYEFDAVPEAVGTRQSPLPGSQLLASARQRNLEWQGIDIDRGADLIDWVRPAGGRVISLGSIGASGSLGVDAGISTFVRNVLAAFGVARDDRPMPPERGLRLGSR